MKVIKLELWLCLCLFIGSCASPQEKNESDEFSMEQFPHIDIANDNVQMTLYPPDPENGLYRATRFDWSGVIGSVQYEGHEYFGYWKDSHDPLFHEDLAGPVEGFIKPGLGYEEAEPGEGFIRIGVGILEKPDEEEYQWRETYNILDHGEWEVNHGQDWITFTHEINSDFGYAYVYTKTIRLKENGFTIDHTLQNTGEKTIETDQFNHNFFMIDGETSGPAFKISFPYDLSTESDLKGLVELKDNEIHYLKELQEDNSVFVELKGYSDEVSDHQVTVLNQNTGAGVTFTVDKPIHRMAFWTCETTLSPENFIWISVAPGEEERWVSDYTLFVE